MNLPKLKIPYFESKMTLWFIENETGVMNWAALETDIDGTESESCTVNNIKWNYSVN